MKLFILTLVAICVGFSESKTNGNTGGYPDDPVKALSVLYNIKPKDMNKCKVADDYIRMHNVRYNLKAMSDAKSKQPQMKDDVSKQLSYNVIAAALPCLGPTDVNQKVDAFMSGMRGEPEGTKR